MTDLWQRLQQRKMVQWAVAYSAAAFALLQGIDIVGQKFGWPDSIGRILIIASFVGFFITLVLAWYHGERGEQKVSGTELLLLSLLLLIGGGLTWKYAGEATSSPLPTSQDALVEAEMPTDAATTKANPKSIAVLPFTNMSADKDDAYFADGLSEETINALSRVPDLLVAARTSSFAFRNSNETIPAIAQELMVATVLEGSVRRAGQRLRMTAQLIRAADGFELWSETYDRSSDDIIAIQEDVALSIAQALKTATDPQALAAMQRSGTRSVPAYQAYLKGLALAQRSRQEGRLELTDEALAAFNHATGIDPGFADAYARAADLESDSLGPSAMGIAEAGASDYADRLQRLHDNLNRASANARNPAERSYYNALREAANQQFVEALKLMRLYMREYPNAAQGYSYLAEWSLYLGDYISARAAVEEMVKSQLTSDFTESPVSLLVWAGDAKRAEHFARISLLSNPEGTIVAYQAHRALLNAGAVEDAATLLPQLMASELGPLSKVVVQVRQACAEGRAEDAGKLYESMASIDDSVTSTRWIVLQLLARFEEASSLFDYMDTPVYFNALSSFLLYPYFDVSRYPNLEKVLLAQGIQRPPPVRPTYACKPEVATL